MLPARGRIRNPITGGLEFGRRIPYNRPVYIFDLRKKHIDFDLLETEVVSRAGAIPLLSASGAESGGEATLPARLTRSAMAFFEYGRQKGPVPPADAPAPPATVLRERSSGRLRAFHREIVIRFQPKTPQKTRQAILGKYGFKVRRTNRHVRDQVVVYDVARKNLSWKLLEVANDWAAMEEVIFATPNFISEYTRAALPIPHAEQWHLVNRGKGGQKKNEDVSALKAWGVTAGKRTITVAVLDDGVDIDHPNLKSRIAPGGRDFFVAGDHAEHENPRPKIFRFPFHVMAGNDIHGTPCAGVIAAAGKAAGAVGIAPRCRILAIKVFHADDLASDERVADAIRYAAANADILSCSWSGGSTPDVQQALEDAGAARGGKGAAVFCATGNESRSSISFPARDPNAIAVGASTDLGERASYSNFGAELSVVAPSSGGVKGIFTTDVGIPYRGFNVGQAGAGGSDGLHTNDFGGTSSATPLAAGVAALVLSVRPDLSRAALKGVLERSADKIGDDHDAAGHSIHIGFGRVNAAKAIELAKTI